ncbi:MAG: hypothetical protein AAFP28_12075 [Pseudomonadota bacterium]
MIKNRDARGRALSLLGFRAAQPLLPELRLRLDQPEQLRRCVQVSAKECTPAAYHPVHEMWFTHHDALHDAFWANAPAHLGPDDMAAVEHWFARGRGHHDEDLATWIWWGAVTRIGGSGFRSSEMTEDELLTINGFIADVWEAWRDEDYNELVEEMRDAELDAAEEDLETRFAINFFDDVMDPLDIFTSLRKGNILHEALDRWEAKLPMAHVPLLAQAQLEGPDAAFLKDHRAAEAQRVARDIRSIRAG